MCSSSSTNKLRRHSPSSSSHFSYSHSSSFLPFWAISVAACLLLLAHQSHQAEAAYTYQKLNELMPELRQFLGRTHLGTLRPLSGQPHPSSFSFLDDDQIQASKRTIRAAVFRERKSNNLRNLMRIGKRRMPGGVVAAAAIDEAAAMQQAAAGMGGGLSSPSGGAGAVYYFSPSFPNDNQFQAYRPQSVWLRK